MVTSPVKREVAGSNPAGGAGGVRRDTPVKTWILVGSNPASVPSGTDTLSPLIPPFCLVLGQSAPSGRGEGVATPSLWGTVSATPRIPLFLLRR